MTRLDASSELAALVRVQVAALRKRRAAGSSSGEAASTEQPGEDLAATMARRISAIPAADPDRERKALRLFLETVLLSELGASLANDPRFAAMVDHVQEQMESDAELARASAESARILLAQADDPGSN